MSNNNNNNNNYQSAVGRPLKCPYCGLINEIPMLDIVIDKDTHVVSDAKFEWDCKNCTTHVKVSFKHICQKQ